MLNQALSYFLTQYLLPAFAFTLGSQITLGGKITGYYPLQGLSSMPSNERDRN